MYYLEDVNQAEIASRLGTSRPTVSRLLSEARRRGIVHIEVIAPPEIREVGLADRVAEALGLGRVLLTPAVAPGWGGAALAPAVSNALRTTALSVGDVLLVGSGRTVYEIAEAELPPLPGVIVAPTIGGHDEPDGWYQPNEIVRRFANKVGGVAQFLFAPAMPSPSLYESLRQDPGTARVLEAWKTARCVLMGVGAPPLSRSSLPRFVERNSLLGAAVGDVVSRFYDRDGVPVTWTGSDFLVALPLQDLVGIPVRIAVAYGEGKVAALLAGARAGYFNQLVSDIPTGAALLEAAGMKAGGQGPEGLQFAGGPNGGLGSGSQGTTG